MNKIRKAMLFAGCIASSFALASCGGKQETLENHSMDNAWIITEMGNKDVLFDAKDVYYGYDIGEYTAAYGTNARGSGAVEFTSNVDNKKYVASEFFIFEYDNKPAKALYDIEYGSKEWNDLYSAQADYTTENQL